jgi:hypothetical protein
MTKTTVRKNRTDLVNNILDHGHDWEIDYDVELGALGWDQPKQTKSSKEDAKSLLYRDKKNKLSCDKNGDCMVFTYLGGKTIFFKTDPNVLSDL